MASNIDTRLAVSATDWERMKEDSLVLKRGRRMEPPSFSPKRRRHSLAGEETNKVPLKNFISRRSKRPPLSRIPRLSSLQQLRPTPTVIAAAEALADEVNSKHDAHGRTYFESNQSELVFEFGLRDFCTNITLSSVS